MRYVALILGLLAALKLGYQEMTYRSATSEVIVGAYRERAIQACRRAPSRATPEASSASWSSPASITLAIGKSGLDVYLWQVDHKLWNARFRNPYLFLTSDLATESLICEYDIINNSAFVSKL